MSETLKWIISILSVVGVLGLMFGIVLLLFKYPTEVILGVLISLLIFHATKLIIAFKKEIMD